MSNKTLSHPLRRLVFAANLPTFPADALRSPLPARPTLGAADFSANVVALCGERRLLAADGAVALAPLEGVRGRAIGVHHSRAPAGPCVDPPHLRFSA